MTWKKIECFLCGSKRKPTTARTTTARTTTAKIPITTTTPRKEPETIFQTDQMFSSRLNDNHSNNKNTKTTALTKTTK